nr:MAG TPA: hypothetical protein [Bacteriophage sp.]DAI07801.1 MAG TPA: hypothetical protein [Bacteriophage sp.]
MGKRDALPGVSRKAANLTSVELEIAASCWGQGAVISLSGCPGK